MHKQHIRNQRGTLLVEALIAMAAFAMFSSAIISMSVGGFTATQIGGEQAEAEALAQEGIEAVKAIKDIAWNDLDVTTSSVSTSTNGWQFDGEGTVQTIGEFTRTIVLSDVCRDAGNAIASCPSTYEDPDTKQAVVTVSWKRDGAQASSTVQRSTYLTNWDSSNWTQTDWSGGSGQTVLSDATAYDADDANVDGSVAGQLSLASIGQGGPGCSSTTWEFTTDSNYTYDSNKIEFVNGIAQLKEVAATASSSWDFGTEADYTYNSEKVEFGSGSTSLKYLGATGQGSWDFTTAGNYTYDSDDIEVTGGIASLVGGGGIDANTLGLWKFEESSGDYADETTNSNTIDARNTPSYQQTGKFNYAVYHNKDYGRISSGAQTNLDPTGAFTIDFWIKPDGGGGSYIVYKYKTSSQRYYVRNYSNGRIYGIFRNGGQNVTIDTGSGALTTGVWQHVAIVGDGSNIKVYIDGTLEDTSGSYSGGLYVPSATMYLPYYIYATIDELRISDVARWTSNFTPPTSEYGGSSYPDDEPSIYPTASVTDNIREYTAFSETATKNGGEIYYQLSDDDGATWKYWDGAWSTAGATDYNTAQTITDKIQVFPTSSGKIMVKAFLESDGTHDVELDTITISYDRMAAGYPTDGPSVTPVTSTMISGSIDQWYSFSTTESGAGTIYYQLSDDEGTTWKYWSGAAWATASQSTHYNTAADINTNIQSFATTTGKLLVKSFLVGDGSQDPILDNIKVNYLEAAGQGGLDANTLALWHFDEASGNAIDETDNNNDLTATSITYGQSGKFDSAISNSSGRFTISAAQQTNLATAGAFTIDFWLNPAANWSLPIYYSGSGSYYFYPQSNGSAYIYFNVNSQSINTSLPSGTLTAGQWQHIAIVGDGTDVKVYVDGTLELTSGAYSAGINATGGTLYVAYYLQGGYMDEVRFSDVARWTSEFTPPTAAYSAGGGGGETGYPTDLPTIQPTNGFNPSSGLDVFNNFVASSSVNGGEVYYQLSDDDGSSWLYWDGSDWISAGSSNYNTSSTIAQNIKTFPTSTEDITFKAFLESDGQQQIKLDDVQIMCANFQMEVGSVSVDDGWKQVDMQNIYAQPVIVTTQNDTNNTLPAAVRIRNITSSTFELRLQHPSGSSLNSDTINYIVVEEGEWNVDGINIEAGLHDTNTVGYTGNWSGDTVSYDINFTADPIVLHQVQTYNDANWITSFASMKGDSTQPPESGSFWLALNGSEVVTTHSSETIGWIAMDAGENGTIDTGVIMETEAHDTTASIKGYDDQCSVVSYTQSYASTPISLASQNSIVDQDGGWLTICSADSTKVGMHIQEDQSTDSERGHSSENAARATFTTSFNTTTATGGGGGGGYQTSGELTSSGFDMGDSSPVHVIEWDEVIDAGCGQNCTVQVQISTAPDSGGSPGTWTNWYGATGSGTYFTEANGTLISNVLNDNQWVRYRVQLDGDGTYTPVLEEIRINHK